MKTIKLNNGRIVQVSYEIYQISGISGLFRKISGLDGHEELGYHRVPGYNCFIPIGMCYDGADYYDAYKGFHKDRVCEYHTHPLNHRG